MDSLFSPFFIDCHVDVIAWFNTYSVKLGCTHSILKFTKGCILLTLYAQKHAREIQSDQNNIHICMIMRIV